MIEFRRMAAAVAVVVTVGMTVAATGVVASTLPQAAAAPAPAGVPAPADAQSSGLAEQLVTHTGGTARFSGSSGSKLDFIGGSAGHPLAEGDRADPGGTARAFVDQYGPLLGVSDRAQLSERSHTAAATGGETVRYDQRLGGVPVLGAAVSVRIDGDGRVLSTLGHVSSAAAGSTTPAFDAATAAQHATAAVAAGRHIDGSGLSTTTPVLQWYDPSVFDRTKPASATLVWSTDVVDQGEHVDELVLVDASTGGVTFEANQLEHAINRRVCDQTGTICRVEGGPATSSASVEKAYQYLGDVFAFYHGRFGRDGLDNAGMPIVAFTDVEAEDANAHWDPIAQQLVFGVGFAVDDVVAHEATHAVTQFTSNLAFFAQPGAINESMSDVFGEFVDLTNGHGSDLPSQRWLMGEELPGGAIRDMANPPHFGQPDRLRSPLYDDSAASDPHGGSGVGNKAAALLTDGGSFNGQTVTGVGIDKVARIFYEANANLLTTASDYNDLGNALVQACTNLLGVGGVDATDCAQVSKVVTATEMNLTPANPSVGHGEAPVCPTGQAPRDLFRDDMEDPFSGRWVLDNQPGAPGVPGWGYDTVGASSGQRALVNVLPGTNSDKRAQMANAVALPAGQPAFLWFSHADQMGAPFPGPIGGTVEYSTDGGATWLNVGSKFTDNPYNGSVFNAATGALPAFNGESQGFYSSRASLAALAGQSVQFRFRMLSALPVFETAWFIDDVRVYTCTVSPTAPGVPEGVAAVPGVGQAVVSWRPPGSDGGSSITGYTVTASPGGASVTVGADARSAVVGGLANGPAYAFTVRAVNSAGASPPSAATAPLVLTAHGGPLFHPLTPARIVDSRDGTGTPDTPWTAGESRAVNVAGRGGVPASHVSAVVANVTETDATAGSHLTVWPTGQTLPTASNLNFTAGQTVANHITVGIGSGGQISVFNHSGQVDVIVDVLGYYDDGTTAGDAFVAVTPTRLLDSRIGTGGPQRSWGGGETRNLTVAGGSSPVPANATAVVMNVTGVFPSHDTHISVWPAGQALPSASSVNLPAGGVVPNLVTVEIGAGGQVSIRNNAGTMDVLADVVGYYVARPTGGRFVPLLPHRILDSRDGTGILGVPWAFFDTRQIQVAGEGGVPVNGASAVVLNVTAVGPTDPSHLTCYPGSTGRPASSNLNFVGGQTVANQIIVGLGTHGDVSCYNNEGLVHVVVDVVGYMT